jgi:histidinol-phosphate aminotransferase
MIAEPTGAVAHGGAPRGWLDFSANVGPFGVSPEVSAAVARSRYDSYGELDARPAERRLATEVGLPRSWVMLTAGATEALRLAAQALLEEGQRALVLAPTYGEYARIASSQGAQVVEVRAQSARLVPPVAAFITQLASGRFRLAFVCDPNNPTGARLRRSQLRTIVDALPARTILVLDQSFVAFSGEMIPVAEIVRGGRVIVVRSLTKRLAAPGLRVGYVVAAPSLVGTLRDVRDPWPLSAQACSAAASASWALSPSARATLAVWRRRLAIALRDLGLVPRPSVANFLLAEVGPLAERLVHALACRRIAVRWCASFGLPDHVRIAVRPPDEQDRLIRALRDARLEVRW